MGTIIQEEAIPTGGHYQSYIGEIDVAAGDSIKTLDISFPHPINLLSASFQQKTINEGDQLKFEVAPDTIIGAITADISIDDVELSVSATVIQHIEVGYWVTIGAEDFGRVISKDEVNSKIIIENSALAAHTAGAYVQQTIKMLLKGPMDSEGPVVLGEAKIGGSYISANKKLRATYYNDSGTAKKYRFYLEYLY